MAFISTSVYVSNTVGGNRYHTHAHRRILHYLLPFIASRGGWIANIVPAVRWKLSIFFKEGQREGEKQTLDEFSTYLFFAVGNWHTSNISFAVIIGQYMLVRQSQSSLILFIIQNAHSAYVADSGWRISVWSWLHQKSKWNTKHFLHQFFRSYQTFHVCLSNWCRCLQWALRSSPISNGFDCKVCSGWWGGKSTYSFLILDENKFLSIHSATFASKINSVDSFFL